MGDSNKTKALVARAHRLVHNVLMWRMSPPRPGRLAEAISILRVNAARTYTQRHTLVRTHVFPFYEVRSSPFIFSSFGCGRAVMHQPESLGGYFRPYSIAEPTVHASVYHLLIGYLGSSIEIAFIISPKTRDRSDNVLFLNPV